MFGHGVTHYSEDGEKLRSYETMADAVKDTGELRSSILSQIQGKRKYSFWTSHIYYNNITLRNGKVIEIKKPEYKIPTPEDFCKYNVPKVPIFDEDEVRDERLHKRLGLSLDQVNKIVLEWYQELYPDILQDEYGDDLEEILERIVYK